MRPLATLSARLLFVGAVVLAAAACGGAQAGEPSDPPAGSPAGDAVQIVAKDLAFTEASVTAPANTPFQIAFENAEGAPHNVAVYRDSSAAEKISIGEIFSGPGTKVQAVPALAPGSYFFRCDVHPDMTGTLVVQ